MWDVVTEASYVILTNMFSCINCSAHDFLIASAKCTIYSWTYFVGSSCNCQPRRGGLHFSRRGHGALQVIKLANEFRMYCGASSAYATKNCLAFVMPASCILDAMVKEISGEPFSIFTVLQELSTWQKCRKHSACYPFFSTAWLSSRLLCQYWRECAWNLEERSWGFFFSSTTYDLPLRRMHWKGVKT